jgi:hypothetical protein
MTEHFSKWLELVPLPNRNIEGSTYAFLDKMFNRFGVLAKVFIDQGMEFWRDFKDLCEKPLIDQRTISWYHLEVDGLVEGMVQTVKQGLWKYGLQKGHTWDWDL